MQKTLSFEFAYFQETVLRRVLKVLAVAKVSMASWQGLELGTVPDC